MVVNEINRAMGNPRWPFGSSRRMGKPNFCILSCIIVHLSWASLHCHLVWVVLVCMFSKWVEVFPCCKADALTETKKLLENMFPTWGIVSKCSLKAIFMAPPWWLGTCHCFPSQPLWNSVCWWHNVYLWRFASTVENLAGLAEPSTTEKMDSEFTQNSRTRHHSDAVGSRGQVRPTLSLRPS